MRSVHAALFQFFDSYFGWLSVTPFALPLIIDVRFSLLLMFTPFTLLTRPSRARAICVEHHAFDIAITMPPRH